MTNVELINELRYCFATHKTAIPWYVWCDRAADALEAADKRIVELNTKCADLQSHINSMESEIEELLPKEGEWIDAYIGGNLHKRCPRCGTYIEATFFANDYDVSFCPVCGSKVKVDSNESSSRNG